MCSHSQAYLTAPGTILAVEARHASYLRAANTESPFPEPFDTPLDFMDIFSLAAPFITGGDVEASFQGIPTSHPRMHSGRSITLDLSMNLATFQYYYEAGRSSLTFQNAGKMYPLSSQVYTVSGAA